VALLIVVRLPMSAPAQKARPLPVTTTARTSGSASASSRREQNEVARPPQPFIRSGRLRVNNATPVSRISYRTGSVSLVTDSATLSGTLTRRTSSVAA
jgi:hypothetical protein